jgi:hypothetical protein
MATLSVQTATHPRKRSIALASASGGGDVAPNDNGGVSIVVRNGDASAKTVTIKSYFTGVSPPGTEKSDLTLSIPAGEVAILGPFDAAAWNNALKQVEITYSAVTSVTVAAIKGV